jgi:hypothetical protein
MKLIEKYGVAVAPPGHFGYLFEFPDKPWVHIHVFGPPEVWGRVNAKDAGNGDASGQNLTFGSRRG